MRHGWAGAYVVRFAAEAARLPGHVFFLLAEGCVADACSWVSWLYRIDWFIGMHAQRAKILA